MTRANFRVHYQHALRATRLHRVTRLLYAKGSGGAGHIHVESESGSPQCGLHFNRHRRIGSLHVGGGHNHGVDLCGGDARSVDRLVRRQTGDFTHHGRIGIGPFGYVRDHSVRVEDAGFVDHVAGLDARRFFDKFGR